MINLAKIILHCRYLRGNKTSGVALANLVKYIATREGVEKVEIKSENENLEATKKQLELIKTLEKEFGIDYDLPEFEDFIKNKTQKTASEYISAMIDLNLHKTLEKENLVEYIAKRPRVDKDDLSNHGLFCVSNCGTVDESVDVASVMQEISAFQGIIRTNVLSLRREDAAQTGFEKRDMWADLLRSKMTEISEQMKIPIDRLKVYGAFHNEGHHPHCHFIAWDTELSEAHLTQKGIKNLKSEFARAIFREHTYKLAEEKTLTRDEIRAKLKEEIGKLSYNLETRGIHPSSGLEMKLLALSKKLPDKGKKQFGYLPKELKREVIDIVDELTKVPDIGLLYDK